MKCVKCLIILICVAITGLCSNVIGNIDNFMAEVRQQQMNSVLEDYFEQRENEFLERNISQQMTYNDSGEMSRIEAVKAWKNELDIELVSVDIIHSIREVISDTETEMQILLYEWVSIEYKCNGYDIVETMGFGTDHLVTLSKESNTYEVIGDIYSEIIGYETGTEEELQLLYAAVEKADEAEMESYACEMNEVEPYAAPTSTAYNASLAVSYSNRWCGNSNEGTSSGTMTPANYNPEYYYIPGADCCNFVSQCLHAGGLPMKGNWYATLNTSGNVTAGSTKSGKPWRYVPSFEEFWESEGYTVSRITDVSQAKIGNPIYWLAEDGYSNNHVMLIVGTNSAGKVLVNGHNYDMYRYPRDLDDKIYYTINIVHTHDYEVFSYTSTIHTMQCTICEYQITGTHVMQNFVGFQSCVTCGYTVYK